jgi:hypothetical protein
MPVRQANVIYVFRINQEGGCDVCSHNPDLETDRLIEYVSGKCGKQPQGVDME